MFADEKTTINIVGKKSYIMQRNRRNENNLDRKQPCTFSTLNNFGNEVIERKPNVVSKAKAYMLEECPLFTNPALTCMS